MDYLYIGAVYNAGKVHYSDDSAMDTPTMLLYDRASKTAYRVDGEEVSGENAYTMRMSALETINVKPGVYDIEIYINYDDEEEREMAYYKRDAVKAIQVSGYVEPEEEEPSNNE